MKANDTRFVCTLPTNERLALAAAIVVAVQDLGFDEIEVAEHIERALSSRVCDLADLLDLESIEA